MERKRLPSPQAAAVLAALAAQPAAWRHGYELSRETGLASGTLYPLLVRLHQGGLLDAEWRPSPQVGRPARHAYRLTAAGVRKAAEVSSRSAVATAGKAIQGAPA